MECTRTWPKELSKFQKTGPRHSYTNVNTKYVSTLRICAFNHANKCCQKTSAPCPRLVGGGKPLGIEVFPSVLYFVFESFYCNCKICRSWGERGTSKKIVFCNVSYAIKNVISNFKKLYIIIFYIQHLYVYKKVVKLLFFLHEGVNFYFTSIL
jgi:hypothetical protein